jgi:hypothetical protein
MRRLVICAAVFLMAFCVGGAAPVVHKFELWTAVTEGDAVKRSLLLTGWTNGFIQARGAEGLRLAACLETMSYDQMVAMVDKYYKDHPERWSRPFGEEVLNALTVNGSRCEGIYSH